MNDEQLFERRHRFLTQRLAGGTFRVIAERHNKAAIEAAVAAGRPVDEAETVSSTTVRKDVDRARAELIDGATRDALRGEHRAILLDMRRANYAAMASGDIDAAKVVMSTLVREAEMFGLDEPKRTQIGVGTDVEFATDLVGLIEAVGYTPPDDLLFAAGERRELAPAPEPAIDAEVVEAPEEPTTQTRAAAGGVASGSAADGHAPPGERDAPGSGSEADDPAPEHDQSPPPGVGDGPWSNL